MQPATHFYGDEIHDSDVYRTHVWGSGSLMSLRSEPQRSSGVKDVAAQMQADNEFHRCNAVIQRLSSCRSHGYRRVMCVFSTVGCIIISAVDFSMHCAMAIWMTTYYPGEHQVFWSFIVLALVANISGIITYIARQCARADFAALGADGVRS